MDLTTNKLEERTLLLLRAEEREVIPAALDLDLWWLSTVTSVGALWSPLGDGWERDVPGATELSC